MGGSKILFRWADAGVPGFDFVLVGYAAVGSIVGTFAIFVIIYLFFCLGGNRNPFNYNQDLDESHFSVSDIKYIIGYLIVAMCLMFVPYGNLISGIISHFLLPGFLTKGDYPKSKADIIIPIFIMALIGYGIFGWFVIDSGMLEVNPPD